MVGKYGWVVTAYHHCGMGMPVPVSITHWSNTDVDVFRNVLCCQHATSSMGTVNRNSSLSLVGPWVCIFIFFRLNDVFFMFVLCYMCFVLPWAVESFPFMFWRWHNTLSFLLPPHYCVLGAGSIPLRAIVNKKQCETRGLFMSLVFQGASIFRNIN